MAAQPEQRWLLTLIRTVHSAIFMVMLSAIGWFVATGVTGRRDRSVAVAAGLVAIESGVFLANSGVCPLTPLAERYGARRGGVSDIFLPDALARTIPLWATTLVAIGAILHIRGVLLSIRRGNPSSVPDAEADVGVLPLSGGSPRDRSRRTATRVPGFGPSASAIDGLSDEGLPHRGRGPQ
jgi:hypothetical protein